MADITDILFFASVGSLASLLGATLLLSNKATAKVLELWAAPFAAGALLAAAFTELLPELIRYSEGESGDVGQVVLLGVLIFFLFERFIRYFHHHHEHGSNDENVNRWLVIVADTIHNFLDGIAIGAAFTIDYSLGVVTTMAVALHEIPQEIGDFGLLLSSGMKKSRVFLVNITSALATIVGAVLVWVFADSISNGVIVMLIGLAMGSFIYIALSDIIPNIHNNEVRSRANIEAFLVVFGAVTVIALTELLETVL